MTIDIKNFYLATLMERYEYIKLKLSALLAEIVKEYKLFSIATPDGSVYVEVRKGMYGLPQAGKLANELLEKWTHKTRPISSTLVVDNFGVKYVGEEHAKHLMSCLQQSYDITHEWKGE